MESQPQNPEFRNYPENFHFCITGNVHNKKPVHVQNVPVSFILNILQLNLMKNYLLLLLAKIKSVSLRFILIPLKLDPDQA